MFFNTVLGKSVEKNSARLIEELDWITVMCAMFKTSLFCLEKRKSQAF